MIKFIETIFIIQPETADSKQPLIDGPWLFYETIFRNTINFKNLFHFGSLSQEHRAEFKMDYCGGTLSIHKMPSKHQKLCDKGQNLKIHCSKCKIKITSNLQMSDLSRIIFFLMLKQMVPDIATADYLDNYLNIDPDTGTSILQETKSRESLTAIHQKIGSISFQITKHCEFIAPYQSASENFVPGFTIMPGIKTKRGCDGLDRWLQFLFCKYYKEVKKIHSDIRPQLLGSKSTPAPFFL